MVADHSFGHGIGAGDINKDGRTDIITPTGWFEAPVDPRSGTWTFHGDFQLGETGFIHVLDVNGDGRPDIVFANSYNNTISIYQNQVPFGGPPIPGNIFPRRLRRFLEFYMWASRCPG